MTQKIVTGSVLVVCLMLILTGCSGASDDSSRRAKEKSKADVFAEYKGKRPEAEYKPVNEPKIDDVGKNMASLYGQTVVLLDDYIAATEGNRTYVAFTNDTVDMNSEEKNSYFKNLTAQQQNEISAVQDMDGFKNLIRTADLLLTTKSTSKSVAGLSNIKASGLGLDAIKQGKAIKHISSQSEYTLKTLYFLTQQYSTVQNLKSNSGR